MVIAIVGAPGSSPLTRGKPDDRDIPGLPAWLIPAHAGKTVAPAPPTPSQQAHPRSRGENIPRSFRAPSRAGSSPLTRGKPYCLLLVRVRVGLIPAHAGKTRVMVAWSVMRAAHPRSRGENDEKWAASDAMQGSSPLTRGKCRQLLGRASIPGLIPAHAGKTTSALTCVSAPRAHPRSRGENGEQDPQCLRRAGSSPLTRGKRRLRQRRPERRRLIPAHAGKTRSRKLEQLSARAHPRSRGENVVRVVEMPVRCSSSPLTRGKLVAHSPVLQARRLIPAHAGKTVAQVVRLKVFRAHPRSRGENRCAGRDVIAPCGSSPLTRGKPAEALKSVFDWGLIPAHAGKTRG